MAVLLYAVYFSQIKKSFFQNLGNPKACKMSIKDMLFQLSETRNENEDLKLECQQLQKQNTELIQQQTWFVNQITVLQQRDCKELRDQNTELIQQQKWFTEQLNLTQQQYGESFQNYLYCCSELAQAQDFIKSLVQNQAVRLVEPPQRKHCVETAFMMLEDVASHRLQTQFLEHLFKKQHSEMIQRAEVQRGRMESLGGQLKNQVAKEVKSHQATKKEMLVLINKIQCQQQEIEDAKQKHKSLKKQLEGAAQERQQKDAELEVLSGRITNQKKNIHELQQNAISMVEKLADANVYIKVAKNDMELATHLSNELSSKCVSMQEGHQVVIAKLKDVEAQLEVQKTNNVKLVQRAVEQQKTIRNLSKKVTLQFSVDKETTEQVISESYQDLQKFFEEKQSHSDHVLALVAYALTHLKYVLEKFHGELPDQGANDETWNRKEFLSQLINHLTRVFLIIPIPIMLKHVDRLSDLATQHGINIKILHMLYQYLPKTAEEAISCRQNVVMENFPEFSSFFVKDHVAQGESVCISVHGFMMLLGISK